MPAIQLIATPQSQKQRWTGGAAVLCGGAAAFLFFLAVLLGSAVAMIIGYRLYTLVSLVILLPMIAVGARRLHDTNRSGWWQLLALVPFGIILVVVFLAQRTERPSANSRRIAG